MSAGRALQESELTIADFSNGELAAAAAFFLSFAVLHVPISGFLRRKLLSGERREPSIREPQFQLVHLPVVALLFILGQVLVGVGLIAFGVVDSEDPDSFENVSVSLNLALSSAAMLLPALVPIALAFKRKGAAQRVGFIGSARGLTSMYSVLRYVSFFPVFLGLGVVTQLLFRVIGGGEPQQDVAVQIAEQFEESPIMIAVFATLVAPLIEEILFRGFLLEFLRERAGALFAVVVSSALFALLHGAAAGLPIFGLALLLASIKLRTGSLAAAWVVHAVHNGLQTLLLTTGVQP